MPVKNGQGSEPVEHEWSLKSIKKLIDLLIARDISEFELEVNGSRVHIRRGECRTPGAPGGAPALVAVPVPMPAPGPGTAPASPEVSPAVLAQAETAPAESTDSLYIIKSPLVGTFYRTPSPNAEAFVKPGDVVRVGQVLCIIEAMKLMNEIESEANGEVVRVYPENGQPVEYGQSLFAIKPSMKK
ncbi:MAG TPA: acetyl-CoA carboxylase biotin carboxyl carrier protein [Terriglobia bacterium]|nr:acetyl-CoA carboxylase biotin carboxyl carrier protein [Terriglobia bacterium]